MLFRSFNVSPSTLEIPESALTAFAIGPVQTSVDGPVLSVVEGRLYRLQGDASVEYQFRPNWRATGSYRRGVEYLAVLAEPVFADGARVELAGLITSRMDVSAKSGYATGASAIYRGTQNLDTYTAEVRIRYALTRSSALYSEYFYYYYDLRGQARLAPDLPSVFKQHAIRAGLMLAVRALGR